MDDLQHLDTPSPSEPSSTAEVAEDYEVHVRGPDIDLSARVARAKALEILRVVGTLDSPSTPALPSISQGRELDPSLLRGLTHPLKIVALAQLSGAESFTSQDVRRWYKKFSQKLPQNLPRDIKEAVRRGWLEEEPAGSGEFYVTTDGREAFAAAFTGTQPAKRRRRTAKRARSKSHGA